MTEPRGTPPGEPEGTTGTPTTPESPPEAPGPYETPPPPPPPRQAEPPSPYDSPGYGSPQAQYGTPPAPAYGYPPAQYGAAPIGRVRGTGFGILLTVVTLGIYPLYWYYCVHDEMKRHKGTGLGGGLAFLIAFLVGIVMPYITSSEVGELYERQGQPKPVSGMTGLWYFPGMLILIGPIVWFVKTNGALNEYWRSQGAQ